MSVSAPERVAVRAVSIAHPPTRTHPRGLRLRPRLRAGSLLTALLLSGSVLAGCSLAGAEEPPQRTAAELATIQAQSPMARSTAAAISTATADAAAWTPTSVPPTATVDPSRSGIAGNPVLIPALLQTADLGGAAWTINPTDMLDTLGICGAAGIGEAFSSQASATAVFSNSLSGWLQQWVYWMPGTAGDAVAYAESNFACTNGNLQINGDNTIEAHAFNDALPGDAAMARGFFMTYVNPAFDPRHGQIAVVRSGDFVIVLGQLDFRPLTEPMMVHHMNLAIQHLQSIDMAALEASIATAP